MAWNFNGSKPVYIQIAERLRNDIITGNYAPGEQIPPVRQLAVTAAVNPNTMQRALTELKNQGLICARDTSGCFVTEDVEILSDAKKNAAKELVSNFLRQAEYMSISKEELIRMIEKENEQ